MVAGLLTLKNLSLGETAMGKQAGWSWDAFKLPPVLEQQLMPVPFAVELLNILKFNDIICNLFLIFFLLNVNWVVDSKSWLISWPNCMIASVTGGIEWSALPKTRMLTFRALGKAAPLEARRIDWIPFFFHPVSQFDINYTTIWIFKVLTIGVVGCYYSSIISERFSKVGCRLAIAWTVNSAILGYRSTGCCR